MSSTPFTLRLLRALVGLAAAALLLPGPSARANDHAGGAVQATVRRAAHAYAELEQKDIQKLSKELDTLIADPAVVSPFVARDRAKLLAVAGPIFEKLKAQNITHWYFLDLEPARTCFLRVHAPTLHGDVISRETLTKAIATKAMGAGKELGKTAFALRVVKPVRAAGKLVGYMELGEEIEHFLGRMKAQTGDDYGLLVDKSRVDRKELTRVRGEDRWEEREEVVLIESTAWQDRNVQLGVPLARLPAEGRVVGQWKDGANTYAGGAFPVRDASDRVVGAMFVRHRVD